MFIGATPISGIGVGCIPISHFRFSLSQNKEPREVSPPPGGGGGQCLQGLPHHLVVGKRKISRDLVHIIDSLKLL